MKIKNLFSRDAWQIRLSRLNRKHKIKAFTKLYYYECEKTWGNSTWLGVPLLKAPTDLWVYQEIICEIKPDFIIETGTYKGGSALFFANLLDFLNNGKVITIDLFECSVEHPRIIKIVNTEGSTSDSVINQVEEIVGKGKCVVILDSTHRKNHVLKEMELYSRFVHIDSYLIVEDTCLGGNPVLPSWGDGPMDAVDEFVKNGKFQSDRTREKFLLTLHPKGFLKRVKK